MSITVNIVAILIHFLCLIVVWCNWSWKSFSHPAFYFSGIWLVSTVSEWYLVSLDYTPTPYPMYIDELNIFALFTSFCFMLTNSIGRKKASKKEITIDIIHNETIYIFYMYLMLIAVIVNFIISGASFSFAQNRMNVVSDLGHVGKSYSLLDSILAILVSPLIFYTISMGDNIGKRITGNRTLFSSKFSLMPLLITLVSALTIGGRNPVIKTLKEYMLGLGLGIDLNNIKKYRSKILIGLSLLIVCVFIFSTSVSEERSELYGSSIKEYDSEFGKFTSGITEYMSCHYWGYQLRRMDFSKGEDLTYGVATFYGLGNLSIPFSSSLGIEGNLWSLFGSDYDPLDVYKSGVDGYYTTSTIYSLLVRDFGVMGSYCVIFLLVLLTQYIFLRLYRKPIKTAFSFIPFILFFTYWSSSNFNSGFLSLQSLLISSVIFDLLQNNYKKKRV